MKKLTYEQILMMYEEITGQTGGTAGIRDKKLLDSALSVPFQSFGGDEAFPSLQQKGARLGYGLVQNHAFVDGNKRIGAHAMLVFLAVNGVWLEYAQKELLDMILQAACGNLSWEEMTDWITEHQV